jgi:hypothetical protein
MAALSAGHNFFKNFQFLSLQLWSLAVWPHHFQRQVSLHYRIRLGAAAHPKFTSPMGT